jgi:hypothetical protein
MTDQTPGCGSTSDARKRAAEPTERAEVGAMLRGLMAQAWDEGHRDVCTDCNCPPEHNPYRDPAPTDGGPTGA